MPKVSVILSSYNHAPYVVEAIESVLNQTFRDFELLIFDDGSVDGSADIIRSFRDERIRTFLYEENRGPAEAAKEAFYGAQGEYVAIHHSDDVWELDKLEKQVAFLDEHEEYAACFTWVSFIDEYGKHCELPENHLLKDKFIQKNRSRAEWVHDLLYYGNCLCHPSLMARRNIYEEYHLLDLEGFWQLPDYVMWLRLCSRASIYIFQEYLVRFRLRRVVQNSTSSANYETINRDENEKCEILENFPKMISEDKFFFEVFPDAEKYCKNGQYNRDFIYAQICLSMGYPSAQHVALRILYTLMQDENQRNQLNKLYGYGTKQFVADMGKYDTFGIRWRYWVLDSGVYIDQGQGMNEENVWRKPVFLLPDGSYAVKFVCTLQNSVKAIRFDPEESKPVVMQITGVTINGNCISEWTSNAISTEEGFQYFLTTDPQYYFDYTSEEKYLEIEIWGKIYQDSLTRLMMFGKNTFAEKKMLEMDYQQIQSAHQKLESEHKQLEHRAWEMEVELASTKKLMKRLRKEIWVRVRRKLFDKKEK